MKYDDKLVDVLKVLATDVCCLAPFGWWGFKYKGCQMLYIPASDASDIIRVCIPHFDDVVRYELNSLASDINEINREVRYVKVVMLGNGSISVNYDHRCAVEEDLHSLLHHILNALCFASDTLKYKLSNNNFTL